MRKATDGSVLSEWGHVRLFCFLMPRAPQYPRYSEQEHTLSPAHLQILELLAAGYTQGEIAVQRGVVVDTIKTQLQTIYKRLGASNSRHAVAIAVSRGYIRIDDRG